MPEKILIIDDEDDIRNLLSRIIKLEGFDVFQAENAKKGLNLLKTGKFHTVICDVKLPDGNGVELVPKIKALQPACEIILLTAFGSIPDSVSAIKKGAFDYITKGDDNNKIIPLVYKATEKAKLQFKIQELEEKVGNRFTFTDLIGNSNEIQHIIDLSKKVAKTDTTVLLTGETGTGKEVFARAIHFESHRGNKPFVAINCSALGKELLESEMFGHKAGAFTGATKDKKGLFEEADKGTIFLDEIGEMAPELQSKLLRVLESGAFMKVGETKETQVDVRVIAATNKDLEKESSEGNFRLDLFYRLSVFSIRLPSLEERKSDIPTLAKYFANLATTKMNKKSVEIHNDFIKKLKTHHWKGNIRELKNVIERAVILSDNNILTEKSLPLEFHYDSKPTNQGSLKLAEIEKQHIRKVLAYAKNNKTKTAKLLGIGLTTLYRKIEEYNI